MPTGYATIAARKEDAGTEEKEKRIAASYTEEESVTAGDLHVAIGTSRSAVSLAKRMEELKRKCRKL